MMENGEEGGMEGCRPLKNRLNYFYLVVETSLR